MHGSFCVPSSLSRSSWQRAAGSCGIWMEPETEIHHLGAVPWPEARNDYEKLGLLAHQPENILPTTTLIGWLKPSSLFSLLKTSCRSYILSYRKFKDETKEGGNSPSPNECIALRDSLGGLCLLLTFFMELESVGLHSLHLTMLLNSFQLPTGFGYLCDGFSRRRRMGLPILQEKPKRSLFPL